MPSDEESRSFIITYSPREAKVNELLQPPLQARLHMNTTDRWVRHHLGNFLAEVELRSESNDAVVNQYFTADSVLRVSASERDDHHGKEITVDFKFDTLKIGTPGRFKFHVRLLYLTTGNADGKDLERSGLEAISQIVSVSYY